VTFMPQASTLSLSALLEYDSFRTHPPVVHPVEPVAPVRLRRPRTPPTLFPHLDPGAVPPAEPVSPTRLAAFDAGGAAEAMPVVWRGQLLPNPYGYMQAHARGEIHPRRRGLPDFRPVDPARYRKRRLSFVVRAGGACRRGQCA
jgi:hypothetical protein